MSKTVKIILIVAIVAFVILFCLCVTIAGVIAVRTFMVSSPLSTATSFLTAVPAQVTATVQETAPAPTALPPSAGPEAAATATQAALDTPDLLPADNFTLDGVDFEVFSVRYTLINGGEDAANYLSEGDDGFLFLATLGSNEKELGFVYDNYFESMRLVDLDSGEEFLPDWANWSGEDSQANSGYVKLSFKVQTAPRRAAIYFKDDMGVDVTPLLPATDEVENPWWDTKAKFTQDGIDLRVQSAVMYSNYTSPDGEKIKKTVATNKILVVRFISSLKDLSGLSAWDPILIDPAVLDEPYYTVYTSWTTAENSGQGFFEACFEITPEVENLILYLPYDNLVDLTPILKKN